MKRVARLAWWALPTMFFVWLYWYGTRAWFQQDDFAWLGQGLEIHSWRNLLETLFAPRAQGTIRPWSERLFFLVFYDRFGLDHRPFHLWVALTQVANLLLLQSIALRITRSRLAAVAAPIIWLAGVGLATPLSWLSAYNEVLCAFFLLLAFRLLLKSIDAGDAREQRRWWIWQTVVFVVGFGALEINVVYPALAAAWCWMAARKQLRRALWLFPISGVYLIVHRLAAANPSSGPYAQHWDLSMVSTYFRYWGNALAAGEILPHWRVPEWSWQPAAWALGAVLAGFAVWSWRRGDRGPAFGVVWFSVVIAPVLPLREHVMDYYVAIPSIGLALILASLLSRAWTEGWKWRVAAAAVLVVHLGLSLPVNRTITRWRWMRGQQIRTLVEGVERAHELHPDKMILLTGMNSDLFWAGVADSPFRLFSVPEIYLAPGEEKHIVQHPDLGDVSQSVASRAATARAVQEGYAVVYQVEATLLRNITRAYGRRIPAAWFSERPREVRVGSPAFAKDLGQGWYAIDEGARWMSAKGEVLLAGPSKAGQELYARGFCPESNLDRPIQLTVRAAGIELGRATVTRETPSFEFAFPVPDELVGRAEMVVSLEVDRTVSPGRDMRKLGLVFGVIGLRRGPGRNNY